MTLVPAPLGATPIGPRPATLDIPGPRSGRRASPALLVTAAAVGLVFASPLAYLLLRNLQLGGDLPALLTSSDTLGPLSRSLGLAASVTVGASVLGTALAWVVVRTDVAGRRLWKLLVPLPLVLPSFVGAAALVSAVAGGGPLPALPDVRGFSGALFVLTLLTYPYVYLTVAARLATLSTSPEESARLLGRRPAQVVGSVVLPQISTSIEAGALLVFLYVLSDFGAVSIVGYDTLTGAIYENRLFRPEVSIALSLVLGLLALVVVGVERARSRRRVAAPGRRSRALTLTPLGRWRAAATAGVVAVVLATLVAPLVVLGWWAVRGLANGTGGGRALAGDLGELGGPIVNTALVGLVTAAVAVAVVLPVAELTARYRARAGEVSNTLVVAGFALPGTVLALALGFWSLQVPEAFGLYQSLPILVGAYVIHFGAQAMRAGQVAVASVPSRMEDAARMLGADRPRRFLTIEAPLMRPGLVAGAGMVLLSTMKELPATLLLAPTGFETLATRTWQANSQGFLAKTGLTSLVLVALSAVLTWLLVLRRSDAL